MTAPIRIAILGNGRQARAEAALTARAYGLMGRQVSRTGKLIAGAFAAREIIRAGAAIVKVGGDYVGSLNKIQALTDSSNRVMDKAAGQLEKNAGLYAKMGQTTGDAASGVVELTKAGLSLNKSLAAVRATMTLAKAGELSVADASTLVANTLNTFSLKASQAGKIANGLANAANISSADVSDLAESFKYVSPLAAKAGVSLDQTNAILAELSNSGVKASQAGTGLRKFLLSLQAPGDTAETSLAALNTTIYDAQGRMKPLTSVIGQLRSGLSKLSAEGQNNALKSIFGLTGITSAQIILKNGTAGLAKYTKGVQRAGAAQKLANAASKGFKGTLDSLKSSVTSTTQELYRRFSPKLNKPLQELAHWLSENQGQMIETGIAAGRRLVPAIKELATAARQVAGDIKDTAVPLAHDLLPALKLAAHLAEGAVQTFNALPGPVREIGVQAAIAALVLPRLTAGVTSVTTSLAFNIARLQQWRAEMTYSTTRAQLLSTTMARLSTAARTAAGVGGMVALTQASQTTNKTLGVLGATAGGALLGFSVGGPWGAAIGAGAGALYGLYNASKTVDSGLKTSAKVAVDYASTLNQITGAATRATRATARQAVAQSGISVSARALGITTRTLVNATLGQSGAILKINRAYSRNQSILVGLQGTKLKDWIREQQIALAGERIEIQRNSGALKRNAHALGEVAQGAKNAGKIKNPAKGWQSDLLKSLTVGVQATTRSVRGINKHLSDGTSKAKPNLKPFLSGLTSGLDRAQGTGRRLSVGVGAALSAGIAAGVSKAPIVFALVAAVEAGIAAAKARAKIHSPSQVMRDEVGAMLGKGLVQGVDAWQGKAAKAGHSLVDRLIKGAKGGLDGIRSSLQRIDDLINKKLDGKKQAAHRKALLKSLKDERAALIANGKAQDHNAALLEKARQRLKRLTQQARDYAKGIKDGFVSYGSVVGLGTTGDSSAVTFPAMLSQLSARAESATKFSELVKKLRKLKLNKTSLQQLLAQAASGDIDGALASAQAIASGGAGGVAQINALTAQIAKAGADLGQKMKDQFFGAGLKAAQGLVDGLKKKQKELDRIAERLAKTLVDKVKKALGIHSPSRVFRDIGLQTVKGLAIGIDDTYATRAGTRLAGSLQKGFGQPALAAYVGSGSGSAPGGDIHVTVNVNVPAGASNPQVGREVVKHLDAYFRAGGRAGSNWPRR